MGGFHFHFRRLIVFLFGDTTLILQNAKQGVVTVERFNLFMIPETPNQSKKIPSDHLQGLSRLRRLHQ